MKASENLDTKESKKLNSQLLRLLSTFGGVVPFSPFERTKTRIQLMSIGSRFGIPQSFITIDLPEHDDLCLLKLSIIRANKNYNGIKNSDIN